VSRSLRVDRQLWEDVQHIAALRGQTASQVAERGLQEYRDKYGYLLEWDAQAVPNLPGFEGWTIERPDPNAPRTPVFLVSPDGRTRTRLDMAEAMAKVNGTSS
jgi:hypothetical protein